MDRREAKTSSNIIFLKKSYQNESNKIFAENTKPSSNNSFPNNWEGTALATSSGTASESYRGLLFAREKFSEY